MRTRFLIFGVVSICARLMIPIESQGQTHEWTSFFVSPDLSNIPISALAEYSDGSSIVIVPYYESLTFVDPNYQELELDTQASLQGLYLAKLNAEGYLVWGKVFTGTNLSEIEWWTQGGHPFTRLKMDSNENIYVYLEANFECTLLPGEENTTIEADGSIRLLKLSPSGAFVFMTKVEFGFDSSSFGTRDFTVSNDGEIYLCGAYLNDLLIFNPDETVQNYQNAPTSNTYVLKLNTNGFVDWVRVLEGLQIEIPDYVNTMTQHHLAISPDGTLAVQFFVQSHPVLIPTSPEPTVIDFYLNESLIFKGNILVAFNSSGDVIWTRTFTGSFLEQELMTWDVYVRDMAFNPDNDLILVGKTFDIVGVGSTTPIPDFNLGGPYNGHQTFIMKLNLSGEVTDYQTIGIATGFWNLGFDEQGKTYLYGENVLSGDLSTDASGVSIQLAEGEYLVYAKYDESMNLQGSFVANQADYLSVGYRSVAISDHLKLAGVVQGGDMDQGPLIHPVPNLEGSKMFISGWAMDSSCESTVIVNNTTHLTCANMEGEASASVYPENTDAIYFWSTFPPQEGPTAIFNTGGLYSVEAIVNDDCSKNGYVYINAPLYPTGFDLSAHLISPNSFQPGFTGITKAIVKNHGCLEQGGTLHWDIPVELEITEFSIAPSSFENGIVTWDFAALGFNETFVVEAFYTVLLTAVMGETVCQHVQVSPTAQDLNVTNNAYSKCGAIINSYDPNDKAVYPGKCNEGFVLHDETLTYTVRFQNTGNSPAINVLLTDSISSNLDLFSLYVIDASHAMTVEVYDNNLLAFRFENIMLPDSTSDLEGSIGHVIFSLKPKSNLSELTQIKNRVKIYFDFNPPIITNTVLSTLVSVIPEECDVGIREANSAAILAFPNPTKAAFKLSGLPDRPLSWSMVDFTGRIIGTGSVSARQNEIFMNGMSYGMYFLLLDNGQSGTIKIVID